MTSAADLPATAAVMQWVDRLTDPSSDVARRTLLSLRATYPHASEFVSTVLIPCQHEIGRRWVRGTATATMEHRVTALFERVIMESLPPVAAGPGPATRAVLSVEGEQHTLAPLVLLWLIGDAGGRADHLGAGVPAADLDRHLETHQYAAVAVSCSTSARLVGALHTIETLHTHGCVVVAGGEGFGEQGIYADLLGADAVAGSLAEGVRVLGYADRRARPGRLDPERVAQATLVESQAAAIAHDVLGGLGGKAEVGLAPVGFLELVATSVRTTAAALLLDRPEIVTEHTTWLHHLLSLRLGQGWSAPFAMRLVVDAVADRAPAAKGLAAAATVE